ncbi:hypothetical protein [Sphingomonas faeni]|uniref:hypothetical protein n=1 Tax=Sphingomonas faeni TaxID=185950 RepID=UPI003364C920
MSELDGGLPGPLGIRWKPVAAWRYRDADNAHAAEQALLARCAAAGCSAGGEFIAVDQGGLDDIVDTGPRFTGRCDRPPSPNGRARRVSRVVRRRDRARRTG